MTGVGVGRSNYYTESIARDDYYKEGGESPGRWYGRAAERLLLSEVEIGYKDKGLARLMLGKDPVTDGVLRHVSLRTREYTVINELTGEAYKTSDENGNLIDKKRVSSPKLAWDFTFSAPKSVSVLWSVADPETRLAIEAAQRKAVETAIHEIEKKASFTRTGAGGVTIEPMDVAFAAFDHTTSRALDPHLHTHVLLINTGVRQDGKGGTVDARGIFETGVHTFGEIYGNTLRHELTRSLGIEMYEEKHRRGRSFEVAGIPRALIAESSKRDQEIREAIRQKEEMLGRTVTSYEKDDVFRTTRAKKVGVNKECLREAWVELAGDHGFDYTTIINREVRAWSTREKREFLHDVTRSLSYKEQITERDILRTALYHAKGQLPQGEVSAFIDIFKMTHLRKGAVDEKHGQLYQLNAIALEIASQAQRSRYQEFRFTVNRALSKLRKWRYEARSKAFERRQRAFKRRITFLYAIGRVDRSTYKRLVRNEGVPTTRGGVQWAYATHQISRRYRDYLLAQVDPKLIDARLDREAKIERWERQRAVREEEREKRITRVKRFLSPEGVRALDKGRLSLETVERHLARHGVIARGESYSKRESRREQEALRRERMNLLKRKGFLSREAENAILLGEVTLRDIEVHLYRQGKIRELPPLVRLSDREKERIEWLLGNGLISAKEKEFIHLGIVPLSQIERNLKLEERLTAGGDLRTDDNRKPERRRPVPEEASAARAAQREAKAKELQVRVEAIRAKRELQREARAREDRMRVDAARKRREARAAEKQKESSKDNKALALKEAIARIRMEQTSADRVTEENERQGRRRTDREEREIER